MLGISREEAVRWHRLMWNWIADESERQQRAICKESAFVHFGWNAMATVNACWACTYADVVEVPDDCDMCPIEWPDRACTFECSDGLHDRWREARWSDDYKEAAKIARQIANLPEKERHDNAT